MADKSVRVEVKGLPQLQRAFKQIESGMDRALKEAFLPIAESVASSVRAKVPHKSGRARGSVKAKASNYGASVAAGGQAAPHYPWLDFGGSVGRGHVPGVPWSGSIKRSFFKSGRYLYPTISSMREETAEAALDAVESAARRAGFEVRG